MKEKMRVHEDLKYTITPEDFEGLTKEETINNLKSLWERNKIDILRYNSTEKERVRLLKENQSLKEKLGQFVIVKKLMDSAGEYGYMDFLESAETTGSESRGKNG